MEVARQWGPKRPNKRRASGSKIKVNGRTRGRTMQGDGLPRRARGQEHPRVARSGVNQSGKRTH